MERDQRAILIVDDEPDLRDILVELIQGLGVAVEIAENGQAGLEKIESKPFAAVLTDLKMPVMNGIELMNEARKRNIQASFVILTGTEERDYLLQAIRLGAVDYLRKPLAAQEVIDTVSRAIEIGTRQARICGEIARTNAELFQTVRREERMISLLRVYNNAQNAKKIA